MNYNHMLEKCNLKISNTVDRTGNFIPYIAKPYECYQKNYAKEDLSWWTNGFWSGIMWMLYDQTKDEKYSEVAKFTEEQFDFLFESRFPALHHDVGFMWMHTALASYRRTEDLQSKRRALHAANTLAARYNPNGEFIVAWNWENGWMIVDSLMNIPILFWASEEWGDPRYKSIAIKHLDTALNFITREDGSANHISSFDPVSGEFIESHGGQGYGHGSTWSRGLSWVVYGMTLAYKYTQEQKYLDAAKKAANYFITNSLQHDYIAPIDFMSPLEPFYSDTTASCIVASALVDLSEFVCPQEADNYLYVCEKIISKIDSDYCNYDITSDGILQGGAERYRDDNDPQGVNIVYGDFFLIEALMKLTDRHPHMW